MTTDVIFRAELMARAGYRDRDSFRAWRARVEKEDGFPKPLPGRTRPLAWSRAAVAAWFGDAPAPQPHAANDTAPPPISVDDDHAAARARLMARSLGRA